MLLAGIAAGMKLKELGETKLGYVAAECAEVIRFTAFYLGAKSVLPKQPWMLSTPFMA